MAEARWSAVRLTWGGWLGAMGRVGREEGRVFFRSEDRSGTANDP
jgi:hypothetical protein